MLGDAVRRADGELNKTYNAIQTFMKSERRAADAEALHKAQRAWIAYRDANCAAAHALYGGEVVVPQMIWHA